MLFGDMNPGSIVLVDVATDGGEEPFTFTALPKGELPDAPPIDESAIEATGPEAPTVEAAG